MSSALGSLICIFQLSLSSDYNTNSGWLEYLPFISSNTVNDKPVEGLEAISSDNHIKARQLLSKKKKPKKGDYNDLVTCSFEDMTLRKLQKTVEINPFTKDEHCCYKTYDGLKKDNFYITFIKSIVPGKSFIISEVPGFNVYPSDYVYDEYVPDPYSTFYNPYPGLYESRVISCVFKDRKGRIIKKETITPSKGEKCELNIKDGLIPGKEYTCEVTTNTKCDSLCYDVEFPTGMLNT